MTIITPCRLVSLSSQVPGGHATGIPSSGCCSSHQRAVEVEGPGVIGTLDDALAESLVLEQFRAPMAARICEGAQFPGAVSDDKQRNIGDMGRKSSLRDRAIDLCARGSSIPQERWMPPRVGRTRPSCSTTEAGNGLASLAAALVRKLTARRCPQDPTSYSPFAVRRTAFRSANV